MINFRFNPRKFNYDNVRLNYLNENLISKLNATGDIYISHTKVNDNISIRMPIGSTFANKKTVEESWELIKKVSDNIIKKN